MRRLREGDERTPLTPGRRRTPPAGIRTGREELADEWGLRARSKARTGAGKRHNGAPRAASSPDRKGGGDTLSQGVSSGFASRSGGFASLRGSRRSAPRFARGAKRGTTGFPGAGQRTRAMTHVRCLTIESEMHKRAKTRRHGRTCSGHPA